MTNAAEQYLQLLSQGMTIIRAAGAVDHGTSDIQALSAASTTLPKLLRLHDTYFGRVRSSRKQRAAVKAAEQNHHPLAVIEMVENYAKKIKHADKSWDFRLEMLRARGTLAQLRRKAKKLVDQLVEREDPTPGVEVRRGDDLWEIKIKGPSADIAAISAALGGTWSSVKKFFDNPTPSRTTYHTNVIIELGELDRIIAGEGDDLRVRLTNGAVISGAEFVASKLAESGLVTLVDPVAGPVNLYRTSRFATQKQRLMALAENPICAWPGCREPGENCEMHHIEAWQHGGNTNSENLCTLCEYHNRVNEDGAEIPQRRGKIVRHRGRIAWVPPWGSPIPV